jgi:hypothetical protein
MESHNNKIYLYIGLGLPICLLLFFLILTVIGNSIKPPQNSILFVENAFRHKVSVINNQIKIIQDTNDDYYYNNKIMPIVIEFNPNTNETIKYKTSKNKDGSFSTINLPQKYKINTQKLSNDQYEFTCNNTNNFLYMLLDTKRHCILYKKYFKAIIIPDSNIQSAFLGWIND